MQKRRTVEHERVRQDGRCDSRPGPLTRFWVCVQRSYGLLNSIILFLFTLSFVSLRYCPESKPADLQTALTSMSPISVFRNADVPAWERLVCAPTNAYRHHVLEPYIVPRVQRRLASLNANPIIKDHLRPTYETVKAVFWDRTFKPRMAVLGRQLERLHRRHIQPRWPIVKRHAGHVAARAQRVVRPYTTKVERRVRDKWARQVAPRLAHLDRVLGPYRSSAIKHFQTAQRTANDFYAHPSIAHARSRAGPLARQTAMHAHRHTLRGVELTRTVLVPRVLRGADLVVSKIEHTAALLLKHVGFVYDKHLASHVQPCVDQVDRKIYSPYLKHHVKRLTPLVRSLFAAPSYGAVRANLKGSAGAVADRVSAAAAAATESTTKDIKFGAGVRAAATSVVNTVSGAAEDAIDAAQAVFAVNGQEVEDDDDLSALLTEQKPVKVPADAKPSDDSETEADRDRKAAETRKDVDHQLEILERRFEVTGENQHKAVRNAVQKLADKHAKEVIPSVLQKRVDELQKEAARIVKAFNKFAFLYEINAAKMNATEVKEAAGKITNAAEKAQIRLDGLRKEFSDEIGQGLLGKAVVAEANDAIEDAMSTVEGSIAEDHAALANTMTWFRDVTAKDWARFQAIEKSARAYRQTYQALLAEALAPIQRIEGEARKEVAELIAKYDAEITELHAEAHEHLDQRDGMRILPIVTDAYEHVQAVAGDAIGKSKEQVQQAFEQAGLVQSKDTASILPIPSDAAQNVQDTASGIIGKSKEQVEQALRQAGAAASSATEQVKERASILPVPGEAVDSVRQAASGVIGKSKEQIQQAFDQAAVAASSATQQVKDGMSILPVPSEAVDHVQQAAPGIIGKSREQVEAALGQLPNPSVATPSMSILPIVTDAAASVQDAASGIIGKGREQVEQALSLAGSATEANVAASAQSLASQASGSASSLAAAASASAASVHSEAGNSVHEATRAMSRAVGATPSPESVSEHAAIALDQVASAAHQATRAASRALGATPSPESPREHIESLVQGASSFASSAADQASSGIHQATRSAQSAIGIKPTPETAQEALEDQADALLQVMGEYRQIVADAASKAGEVVTEATQRVKDEL